MGGIRVEGLFVRWSAANRPGDVRMGMGEEVCKDVSRVLKVVWVIFHNAESWVGGRLMMVLRRVNRDRARAGRDFFYIGRDTVID